MRASKADVSLMLACHRNEEANGAWGVAFASSNAEAGDLICKRMSLIVGQKVYNRDSVVVVVARATNIVVRHGRKNDSDGCNTH